MSAVVRLGAPGSAACGRPTMTAWGRAVGDVEHRVGRLGVVAVTSSTSPVAEIPASVSSRAAPPKCSAAGVLELGRLAGDHARLAHVDDVNGRAARARDAAGGRDQAPESGPPSMATSIGAEVRPGDATRLRFAVAQVVA